MLRVAADTGGTFTDIVAVDASGTVLRAKVRSRPQAPDEAVRDGLDKIRARVPHGDTCFLTHGTTVGTNALLENRGAETWLITNAGFEDLLAIGRQHREKLYELQPEQRSRLVPAERTVGVIGRIDHLGQRLAALDIEGLREGLRGLRASSADRSWAVCLLHSYVDGADERRVAELLRELFPGEPVSLSHEVMPEFREVERAGTTVANAHMAPSMSSYLRKVEALVDKIDIMGSSGGRHTVEYAAEFPSHTALSGPAGGVVAAVAWAAQLGMDGVLSFDMGGTSTDVAMCQGQLPLRFDGRIGDFPLHVPMLDIHTVGAGGGSIAFVDAGGALRVGPESTGADPGPACYGVGDRATVTDANVVLGRMPHDILLAGSLAIDAQRAERAIAELAQALEVGLLEAAKGVIDVAVEAMAGAIRRVSVERGVDPRKFPLCAFGGAGGLHVCELAERLGVQRAMVPADAGLLSACGMLLSQPRVTKSATVLGQTAERQVETWSELVRAVREIIGVEGEIVGRADCRYHGQSFELTVQFEDGAIDEFHDALFRDFAELHQRRFGYALDSDVEVVTLRAEAVGVVDESAGEIIAQDRVVQTELTGPETIVRMSTTIYVARGWRATTYDDGAVYLERLEGV